MEGEIINKVAKSGLITFNLEDYYPKGRRVIVDIEPFLWKGIVVKEKEFRKAVKAFDWAQYKGQYVALNCSADAIIPSWAYMLITIELMDYAHQVVLGDLEDLEKVMFVEALSKIDYTQYTDKRVIVKGCSHYPVPEMAYSYVIQQMKPYTKSLMFGEACSTVPLYKKK
ncbi:MAG: DUF2480 family protein [Flavobacteriales bacterium]|jgi:hypothetical protein|nr:DUF2480 family protein [Flavobacteriales bacterium]